jgi:uncharacterized membrane protein YgcG
MKNKIIFGLVIILTLVFSVFQTGVTNASVNDFKITDFQADYYLDKDSEGRSTLKTVESITADFPEFDQNHGIERAIPQSYDGHSVSLKIQSVKDQNGSDLNYSTNTKNDNLVLRIGNANTYVHGLNTYVITYTQRDVTKFFADTNDDEFYWDVNGTEWAQRFDKVTARLHLSSQITDSLNGKRACYFGVSGSTNQCVTSLSGGTISASVANLNPGENMTIAVGFNANMFSGYELTTWDLIRKYAPIMSVVVSVLILLTLCIMRFTVGRNTPSSRAIIPEYLPPKGVDIIQSSVVAKSAMWIPAAYIDLAVRHKIKIIETQKPSLFLRAKYRFEFITNDGLNEIENDIIMALFGNTPNAGAVYEMNARKTDMKLSRKLDKVYKKAKKMTQVNGYFKSITKIKIIAGCLIVIELVKLLVLFAVSSSASISTWSLIICFLVIPIEFLVGSRRPLSLKGRELYDYLKGLKMYIKIGEEDRLKVLQSPEGAEKTPIDTNDKENLIHLYERVLPYAVLFRQEKGWAKVLGNYYSETGAEPGWYSGSEPFNTVMFVSAVSGFSTNSYAASSYSSSGGSGGGGSSGGGGGGGGGGGW